MTTRIYIIGGAVSLVLVVMVSWLFFRSEGPAQPTTEGFGIGDNRSVSVTTEPTPSAEVFDAEQAARQTVFKITDGPVAGATLIETTRPTTTVARYVKQENGHVFDQPIDVPGAVARAVSNTTIPGVRRALWVERGNGVILQYLSDGITKSVYLGFPPASTSSPQAATTTRPTKIQFLPDNIADVTASPDGRRISYLLRIASGVTGYVANMDGSGSAQLFSLPLSQIILSWPAQGALLATSKSAAGMPGIAYSINTTSGLVTPLIHAEGLTAIADRAFSRVIYQTVRTGALTSSTYARDIARGSDTPLSFDPYPEKCIWSSLATSTLYCSAPLEFVPPNYLDLWHLGAASVPDSIFSFDVSAGQTNVIAIPGSRDGGAAADIVEMALAPGENYLSFVARGSGVLWSVRLQPAP